MKKVKSKVYKRDELSSGKTMSKKNVKLVRSVIDLPTAEPEFDLISYSNTSDEEDLIDRNNDGYESVPKTYKHLLRAELKRAAFSSTKLMPPELIITPAQKTNEEIAAAAVIIANSYATTTSETKVVEAKVEFAEKPSATFQTDQLPPISSTKRQNTCHSFKKCVPTIR